MIHEKDMSYRQYVVDATRTETNYQSFEEKLQDDTTLLALFEFLKQLSELTQKLDVLKKVLMYGSPLPVPQCNPTFSLASVEKFREQLKFRPYQRLLHAVLGTATETGEILDSLFHMPKTDFINLREESGDLKWYGAILDDVIADYFNAQPEEVFALNIAKLKARYPDRFTEDAANNRDLEAEQKILNS